MILIVLASLQVPDTVRIAPADAPPVFDGVASSAEYGAPSITVERPGGTVQLWLRSVGNQVYISASIPDASYYWGDDLVLGLDTGGNGGDGPGHDDFQWYFRRALDSSFVRRGDAGKWRMPRDDPDWRLGAVREMAGWEVRSASDAKGWSVELRLDRYYFSQAGTLHPRLAARVYDNDPHGWHPWPSPAGIRQPTEVEDRPRLWIPVLLR